MIFLEWFYERGKVDKETFPPRPSPANILKKVRGVRLKHVWSWFPLEWESEMCCGELGMELLLHASPITGM